MAADAILKN